MFSDGRDGSWRPILAGIAMLTITLWLWLGRKRPGEFSLRARQSFPYPVVLSSNRGRTLAAGIASVGFFAALVDGSSIGRAEYGYAYYVFIFVISLTYSFFGCVLIYLFVRLSRLILGPHSLAVRSLMVSKHWLWEDVTDFRAITSFTRGKRKVKVKRCVGFRDRSDIFGLRSRPASRSLARRSHPEHLKQSKFLSAPPAFPPRIDPLLGMFRVCGRGFRIRCLSIRHPDISSIIGLVTARYTIKPSVTSLALECYHPSITVGER